MSIQTWRGTLTVPDSADNETYNLFNEAIGEDSVGLGVIAANVDGPLGSRPNDSNTRGVVLRVDNRLGDADIYLARPQDIPASDNETVPQVPMTIVPGGQYVEDGPFDLATFRVVVRALAGAQGTVSVSYTGMGWKS